ncbi:FAD:protein FMN transferase [Nocardia aurantiaca]|uniref:FAD:protein FMN transferase n=1 Tax=Nocardia aurantiaca TaxID=2675850 RepID=UPI001E4CAEB5|nr:FAD:protein FMN transferase [Nocardia aurantiaca]
MTAARGEATSAAFDAIGTTATVVCTDPRDLRWATELVRARLAELDRAASRFRDDSELALINARSAELARTDRSARLRISVGATLGSCLRAAARTERLTAGLVCATVGAALMACGYDDLAAVRACVDTLPTGPTPVIPAHHQLKFDESHREVSIPAGTMLDLGASAKAWAADSIASELAVTGSGGYLVDLGGDLAVAGAAPSRGWAIGVRDWNNVVAQVVCSAGQAFATSSTRLRTWVQHGIDRHHIIDPRTGRPAHSRWAQVTCAGPDVVRANAASTAAVILDEHAPQ